MADNVAPVASTSGTNALQNQPMGLLMDVNAVPGPSTSNANALPNQPMNMLMADNAVPVASVSNSNSLQNNPIDMMPANNEMDFSGNGGPSQVQSSNFLKENAEMEQMLGVLSVNDYDFMQVLENLQVPNNENLGELAGGLALFNDVDVMGMGLMDVVHNPQYREQRPQELLAEIETKREKMIRDCDFMMRRLRKIQARHMGRHISEEVCGLFEYTQQTIKRKERETKSISTMTPINQLHSDKSKLNTPSSWKSLLKRVEHAANNQQSNPAASKLLNTSHVPNAMDTLNSSAGSVSSPTAKPAVITQCVPQFDVNGTQQLKQMAGLLSAEMKIVGESFDSDATASSSGGESADEGIVYNNPTQKPLSIAKRAAYRWARNRAKIASRWTWLLAQISELEYRIRLHQEQYFLLKQRNGAVKFEENVCNATASTSESEAMPPPQQSMNGYRGTLPGNMQMGSDSFNDSFKSFGNNDEAELNGSARTRAFKGTEFTKRKLLQSTNLHKISRRAARPW